MNKKEEFIDSGKTYLTVQPCGMLYTQGREYFLLHPYPLVPDWEEIADRFVCVPNKDLDTLETGSIVHPFARHVVTSAYAIDYSADMPIITVEKLNENDLSDTVWNDLIVYSLNIDEDIEPEDTSPVRDVNDVIRELDELADTEPLADDEFQTFPE